MTKNPNVALRQIKQTALSCTDGAKGLAHIVRLCIDAGVEDKLPQLESHVWPPYTGPRMTLSYTDSGDLSVLHHLPMSDGYSVSVVGDPDNAAYEWVVNRNGKIEHSDCGYGCSDIALRDGLIAMHGLPQKAEVAA